MNSVQRRLIAIVAADVAGYSRLMGAFEEETIARLRSHRTEVYEPKLEQYNGRIANTAGDSFLIEFASAVDAVRFSMDVQAGIAEQNKTIPENQQLIFRIGINVGDVVAEGDDLLGDGVNVAARIEALAEPGGICLSRSARDQVRDRLDIALNDMGEIEVKNIARPVRVFEIVGARQNPDAASAKPKTNKLSQTIISVAAALIIAIGTTAWWWNSGKNTGPTKPDAVAQASSAMPSIAVLPFSNLSGDKSQSYFADGITEDIITDLSKVSGLQVTSRSATLRFKNSVDDPKVIAKALKVDHLLAGSVRRAADRVRITAKLISAKTGNQLWAERFDRGAQDIFAVQDEISERVVKQLSSSIKGLSLKRITRKYTPNVKAYDLYIRGRAQRIPPTPANLAAALKSFEKAIEVDPKFAGGYAGASLVKVLSASDSTHSPNPIGDQHEAALNLAKKAIELDPEFGPGWASLAEVQLRTRQYDVAIEAIQKAVKLAPSDSLMRATFGRFLSYVGRATEGIEQVKAATRMSPDSLPMLYFLGMNYRAAGEYKLAVETLLEHRTRLGGRILPAPTCQLIAAYAQLGDLKGAKENVISLLKIVPRFTIKAALRIHVYKSQKDRETFANALRQAGLPE